MKKIIVTLGVVIASKVNAQQITGNWFSADSSRIYTITEKAANQYEAVIITSFRKTDSIGFVVIKNLHYRAAKKRYEGFMYAVSNKQPCFVKITTAGNQLNLKLNRMFFFNVVLQWKRAGNNEIIAAN